MEKPNVIESVTPFSGQYSCRKDLLLNMWLGVAAVTYLVALVLVRRNPEWSPLVRGLVALLPLIPSLLYVRSWLRFVRGMDELQRRVQLEAFLFAALGTILVGTIINILGAEGVSLGMLPHGMGLGGVFMAMFPLWLVGWAIANCRYK